MILSRRVALGGVQLDELHDAIVIRGVDTGVTHNTTGAVSRMGGFGQRMTGEHWDSLDVIVRFAIDITKRQMEERKAVFDAVIAWARRKGWLTFNYMTNRRIWVDSVVYPSAGDAWDWTNEYTITFRAYNVPFWTEETPNQAVIDLSSGGRTWIDVNGNVDSVLDVTFQNRSGMEIPNFTVTANGNTISLTGIALGGSETLTISHGTDGLLRIFAGSRSVYANYTGADDLFVQPGRLPVDFSATRAGKLTVHSYGRWMA